MFLLNVLKGMFRHPRIYEAAKRVYKSDWLNKRGFYHKWVLSMARKADAQIASRVPSILIETTLTCNSRCVMCVHGQRQMSGEMEMDLFKKVITDVAQCGIKRVTLNLYGEPFDRKSTRL